MPKTVPNLPSFLARKIYKTGQTRGADDDDILQNRVARNSTALFPYAVWNPTTCFPLDESFERGYVVLISPQDYFAAARGKSALSDPSLILGRNLLIFYQTRDEWQSYPPKSNWCAAHIRPDAPTSKETDLGGQYVARIAATTAQPKIALGYNETTNKGAGIQGFEYASRRILAETRFQLEAVFWACHDATDVIQSHGLDAQKAQTRKSWIFNECQNAKLWNTSKLSAARIIDGEGFTICPLCLDRLSASGFMSRLQQAEGRATPDLTVTEINLFHINELRYGAFDHQQYNLGWGHHHCNATARDMGIDKTLSWMQAIIRRNQEYNDLIAALKK